MASLSRVSVASNLPSLNVPLRVSESEPYPMSRPPRAPAGAVPHTLKTTLPSVASFVVSLFPVPAPALSELLPAGAALFEFPLPPESFLLPPPMTATAIPMTTNNPMMPRQPRPTTFPTERFFGGSGWNGGCPYGGCPLPHPGCCGGGGGGGVVVSPWGVLGGRGGIGVLYKRG